MDLGKYTTAKILYLCLKDLSSQNHLSDFSYFDWNFIVVEKMTDKVTWQNYNQFQRNVKNVRLNWVGT